MARNKVVNATLLIEGAQKGASREQQVLLHLAGAQLPLLEELEELEAEVASRITASLHRAGEALAYANLLRGLVETSGLVNIRIQQLLGAAATMGAQEELIREYRENRNRV